MQEPRAAIAPGIRLVLAILVATVGAVIVLAGLASILRPAAAPAGAPTASAAARSSGFPAITGSSAAPAPVVTPSPAALPSPTGDPVLVGAGDIATCGGTNDEATAALLAQIPGIVFTLGDNVVNGGTATAYRDCYGPSWGAVLDRTGFVVAGAQDYLPDGDAPFLSYFGAAAAPDGVTWFSKDVGTWHVIVLDSNCGMLKGGCGPASVQLQWLRADLAASTARCTLALWHQPRFSSGFHGDDPAVAPFWDALYVAGADLVLNGHDDDYERFATQDPSGAADPSRGITEVVVGTGGAALRPFGPAIANDLVRSSLTHGVLVLTLQPSGWSFRFVSTDGSFSDRGQGTCH